MSINSQILKSSKVVALTKYSDLAITMVIGALMARLLSPEEFGIVAMITVFTGIFQLFGDFGLSAGIVQFRNINSKLLAPIFTLSILFAIALSLLFSGFSYAVAIFYDDKIYIKIGHLLSFTLFFNILATIPFGILRKEKKFKTLGLIKIFSTTITGILAIVLAINGYGIWALIYRGIADAAIIFFLKLYYSKLPIRTNFKFSGLAYFLRYAFSTFNASFINYFSKNIDNILIGKYLGSVELGIYSKAYNLMRLPINQLTRVVTPVLHPIYSHAFEEGTSNIYQSHFTIIKQLLKIGIPLSFFLYTTANEIIFIMLGNQWKDAIPIFKWLSLSVWAQMAYTTVGITLQSIGKPNLAIITSLVSLISITSAVLFGILNDSVLILSQLILLAFIFNFMQAFYMLYNRVFGQQMIVLLLPIIKPLIYGIIVGIINYTISGLGLHQLLSFFIKLLFFSLLILFNFSGHKWLINHFIAKKNY